MTEPSVSVLIPTFNRAAHIVESLESILNQTLPASQIIVINDGSTDDTDSVLTPYFDRIEYIKKQNGGKSSALNMAFPRVTGDYTWIFDDDDVALPDALERHVRVLENDADLGFTYATGYQATIGADGRIKQGPEIVVPYFPENQIFVRLLNYCFMGSPFIVALTRCYEEVGPFDTALIRSQDYDMALRLSRRYRCARISQPTVLVRVHTGLRGSVADRFPVEERFSRWLKYDQMIFRRLYNELALREYLPRRQTNESLGDADVRQAHLKRMCVMARRALWTYAVTDLQSAFNAISNPPNLTSVERDICSESMGSNLAVEIMLSNRTVPKKILELCGGTIGEQIRFEFARGLSYKLPRTLRDRKFSLFAKIFITIMLFLGVRGSLRYFLSKIGPSLFRA